MTTPQFQEARDQPHESDPRREVEPQLEREELTRRLARMERERDTATGRLQDLDIAYGKLARALTIAKEVISERFGPITANLIRQGIEEQVEREFSARKIEEQVEREFSARNSGE